MQNALRSSANYDHHNAWYNSMFATEIKTEPGTNPIPPQMTSPPPAIKPTTPHSHLEEYLNRQHQQNLNAAMNATTAMTPSPQNNDNNMQLFFDAKVQQQLYQHQQYQQQFQHAQQAAAKNRMAAAAVSAAASTHLGFNPLTPPGLPPPMPTHYYSNNNDMNQSNNINPQNNSNKKTKAKMNAAHERTPSPQPRSTQLQLNALMDMNAFEKQHTTLTPSNTPPMDTIQSIKTNLQSSMNQTTESVKGEHDIEKEHDIISESSEDLIGLEDDPKFYESIYKPRYNSHGKLSTYPCKDCGEVFDTKANFWTHRETHIKAEKILRCPMYPKCPFSTDLKHWMEFHLRKHRNEKPYKCPEPACKYSCETKGMLTSHLKSHSDIYPYKCADCDYAVKFVHSFKQHLRKYAHRPGVVLDDKGKPNPAAVIDVYGRRRGPKSKGGATGGSGKRERSLSSSKLMVGPSQLSVALQGIQMAQQQQEQQQNQEQPMCVSPAKSTNSSTDEMQTKKDIEEHIDSTQRLQLNQHQLTSLLPPLASLLQQNSNMAFLPYWNFNYQMLAAQQQAVVLAQLSPRERETALQQLQQKQQELQQQQVQQLKQLTQPEPEPETDDDEDDEDEDNDEVERKSVDSAMDLSQPADEEHRTPKINSSEDSKMPQDNNTAETPIGGAVTPSRRKGRILQLDTLVQVKTEQINDEEDLSKLSARSKSEESLENAASHGNNTSASSTSNDSGTATSNESDHETTAASVTPSAAAATATATVLANKPAGAVHECKYCDIYFKDPVLYTIHMGYHSCDDAFKCNMCGEKCEGPVGLFVHMARNPHA